MAYLEPSPQLKTCWEVTTKINDLDRLDKMDSGRNQGPLHPLCAGIASPPAFR